MGEARPILPWLWGRTGRDAAGRGGERSEPVWYLLRWLAELAFDLPQAGEE